MIQIRTGIQRNFPKTRIIHLSHTFGLSRVRIGGTLKRGHCRHRSSVPNRMTVSVCSSIGCNISPQHYLTSVTF